MNPRPRPQTKQTLVTTGYLGGHRFVRSTWYPWCLPLRLILATGSIKYRHRLSFRFRSGTCARGTLHHTTQEIRPRVILISWISSPHLLLLSTPTKPSPVCLVPTLVSHYYYFSHPFYCPTHYNNHVLRRGYQDVPLSILSRNSLLQDCTGQFEGYPCQVSLQHVNLVD